MNKQLKFNDEARQSLKDGIDILANAVKVTLGPKGRTVVIEESQGPHITKDGVSVAKAIQLEDPFQNMGAQLVKQVAAKTCDDAGDGTTTATVLAQAIVKYGLRLVAAGASPTELKKGIDTKVKKVVEFIQNFSEQVGNDYSKIEQVATISANNDSEIGKLIADAMQKVSQNGVITVDESKTNDTYIDVVEGMQFDRGYLSPYFVTDTEQMVCEMERPLIIITDGKISNLKEFLPLLNPCAQTGRPILVIAEDVDSEALTTLVVNRMKTALKICAVRAPGFGDQRKEMLEDIAVLTGGTLISESKGIKLSEAKIELVGSAKRVVISKDSTTIVDGEGNQEKIQERVNYIKSEIEQTSDKYEITKLKNRLAKLDGGVAVIHIGASSEVELTEKKDRIDDALCATRAAIEEGIVPGGGITYIRALQNLSNNVGTQDEISGMNIVEKALEEPLRQIVINAGKSPDIIISECLEGDSDWGYDAKTDSLCNLKDKGIIDPAKVTRTALENAASVAGLYLTTECIICNDSKRNMDSGNYQGY